MIDPQKFYDRLIHNDVHFFTGVPDSTLKNLCAYITVKAGKERHIIAANEGTALGIAAGYHLASGKLPLIYMQNSGIGNAVNPLLSLADEMVYQLPVLLLIGWRGEPGVKDEPQHKKQGKVTLQLLESMDIPYIILSSDEIEAFVQLDKIIKDTTKFSKPHAIVVRQNIFSASSVKPKIENNHSLSREEALQMVLESLQPEDIVVSTTGKLSRELFEYREKNGQGHAQDFLTVGSMGHASSIAFGVALQKKNKTIYCLDGDGALLMHLGSLSNIGVSEIPNYRHIIFNNGSHESVGGQPTLAFSIDIPAIAKACGYKHAWIATNKQELYEI
jgi:phosphonopyruvate decarboxylase